MRGVELEPACVTASVLQAVSEGGCALRLLQVVTRLVLTGMRGLGKGV